ncbi:uncharacterized protein PG998_002956 [Apiospora kogelbergensis]|uniref:uncharacterized protein n=1 Tax=Apiospora kogelbergensis TaxID=1337665 RepID=UPI00312D052A
MGSNYRFSIVPHIFHNYTSGAEDSPISTPTIATRNQLGIIQGCEYDTEPSTVSQSQWQRLEKHVAHLNKHNGSHVSYKVIYVARHGRSVHNVVMDAVGSEWKEKWAYKDGAKVDELPVLAEAVPLNDGEERLTWADAQLVDKGREQAQKLGAALIQWSKENGMPLPGTVYTSPLTRCLETTNLIYSDAYQQNGLHFQPVVKEKLRERLTNHTCDKRRGRASIEERYPECSFEPDFRNEDTLWKARTNGGTENAETEAEHIARKKGLLEDIFETDIAQFVSLTTHSYAISALLSVVGSPPVRFKEGAMLAMLVKAEKEPARGIFERLYETELDGMKYKFTKKQDEIAQQISQFWAHSQATGDVKAYLQGDEGHDYAKIDKWVQARTPFTDPPNEKLAEGDTAFIIGNRASFDVAQYLDKPSAAGMSMIHLLALPRDAIYNAVSLNQDNVCLIDDMVALFRSSWNEKEFRSRVLAHQRKAIENAKGDSKNDEGYRLALEHYEELESSIHQIEVKDFKFGLHLFPDQSVSHLHMHIIAATKSMRKYSTSHHDQKTKDALEVRDIIMNGKFQVPKHETATTVTEAADCTAEITICECSDGCMVITRNGRFEKPGTLDRCMEEYSERRLWFVRLANTTVKMVSVFAQDVMGQEVLEMLKEDHSDKARPYYYTQLVAFQAAELLVRIRAVAAQPGPECWQTDLESTLFEFARIQVTGAIYETE